MIEQILRKIIGNRDVQDLTCAEARQIVSEFYFRLFLLTFGQRRTYHAETKAKKVLDKYGLGYFS